MSGLNQIWSALIKKAFSFCIFVPEEMGQCSGRCGLLKLLNTWATRKQKQILFRSTQLKAVDTIGNYLKLA